MTSKNNPSDAEILGWESRQGSRKVILVLFHFLEGQRQLLIHSKKLTPKLQKGKNYSRSVEPELTIAVYPQE